MVIDSAFIFYICISCGWTFSSLPEHEVLRVSYCDSAVSVVHCAASNFYLLYSLEARFLVR